MLADTTSGVAASGPANGTSYWPNEVEALPLFDLGSVTPLYQTNGADWNEYVVNDSSDVHATNASDSPCAGSEVALDACIHGCCAIPPSRAPDARSAVVAVGLAS
jgi:hypothetical protein